MFPKLCLETPPPCDEDPSQLRKPLHPKAESLEALNEQPRSLERQSLDTRSPRPEGAAVKGSLRLSQDPDPGRVLPRARNCSRRGPGSSAPGSSQRPKSSRSRPEVCFACCSDSEALPLGRRHPRARPTWPTRKATRHAKAARARIHEATLEESAQPWSLLVSSNLEASK